MAIPRAWGWDEGDTPEVVAEKISRTSRVKLIQYCSMIITFMT